MEQHTQSPPALQCDSVALMSSEGVCMPCSLVAARHSSLLRNMIGDLGLDSLDEAIPCPVSSAALHHVIAFLEYVSRNNYNPQHKQAVGGADAIFARRQEMENAALECKWKIEDMARDGITDPELLKEAHLALAAADAVVAADDADLAKEPVFEDDKPEWYASPVFKDFIPGDHDADKADDDMLHGREGLCQVYVASNIMDVPVLLELCSRAVADTLMDRSHLQIREEWGIEGDFTPEEEAANDIEYKWCDLREPFPKPEKDEAAEVVE